MTGPVVAVGDRAVLRRCAPQDVPGLLAAIDSAVADGRFPGVEDVVPAAASVLVRFDPARVDATALSAALAGFAPAPPRTDGSRTVEIAVRYDGDDLHAVAAETGLAPHHVVEVHASVTYTVAFCGFAPGFAYLTGLDQRLHLPRLSTPRTRVPAGSVAIAAEYAGVYPRSSPGGWRLLGRTDADLFDPDRREPALLTPGTRVRFVPQGRRP